MATTFRQSIWANAVVFQQAWHCAPDKRCKQAVVANLTHNSWKLSLYQGFEENYRFTDVTLKSFGVLVDVSCFDNI
jgi:hypothetical protein